MIRNRYSVKDASARLGIGTWTLRRLEESGRLPKPHRDPLCNARIYSENDLAAIREALGIDEHTFAEQVSA